jgi:hypothetical protein
MFFGGDSSSGVSGDLDSATQTATWMEGYWGMGKTVSSAATARRLQAGTPGGGNRSAGPSIEMDGKGPSPFGHLADRIEDNLSSLLERAEELIRENEGHILALAHALEQHKTISGEDVTAVMERTQGPLVDGTVYGDEAFIARLRDYHNAALRAHQQHSVPDIPLPVAAAEPAYVVTIPDAYVNGNGNGAGGTEDVVDFGGYGTGNGAYGPWGAPTYDPPGSDGEQGEAGDEH